MYIVSRSEWTLDFISSQTLQFQLCFDSCSTTVILNQISVKLDSCSCVIWFLLIFLFHHHNNTYNRNISPVPIALAVLLKTSCLHFFLLYALLHVYHWLLPFIYHQYTSFANSLFQSLALPTNGVYQSRAPATWPPRRLPWYSYNTHFDTKPNSALKSKYRILNVLLLPHVL